MKKQKYSIKQLKKLGFLDKEIKIIGRIINGWNLDIKKFKNHAQGRKAKLSGV